MFATERQVLAMMKRVAQRRGVPLSLAAIEAFPFASAGQRRFINVVIANEALRAALSASQKDKNDD